MKTTKSKTKPTLKHYTMKLSDVAGKTYTKEDLINILSEVSFDKININLTCKKTYLGVNGLGYTGIGFVNEFDPEKAEFNVVIFENRTEAVEQLKDVVIAARVFTNRDGKITKIIGLDVEPVSEYE